MDEQTRELLKLGKDAYCKKEYARAEGLLEKVLAECDTYPDVNVMMGVILHDRGQLPKAEKMFLRALELNPRYIEAALHLAVTLNDQGRYEEGNEIFQRTISASQVPPGQLDPISKGKVANMYAEIGEVYESSGLLEKAVLEYQRALELGPGFVDIRLRLAQVYRDQGKHDESIRQLRKILHDREAFTPARIQLGVALYARGKKDEARKEWERALADDPGNKSCGMYLALVSPLSE